MKIPALTGSPPNIELQTLPPTNKTLQTRNVGQKVTRAKSIFACQRIIFSQGPNRYIESCKFCRMNSIAMQVVAMLCFVFAEILSHPGSSTTKRQANSRFQDNVNPFKVVSLISVIHFHVWVWQSYQIYE